MMMKSYSVADAIRNVPLLLIVISHFELVTTSVLGMGAARRIKIMMLVYAKRNARRDTMELPLPVGDPVLTFVEKDMLTGALLVLKGGISALRGAMVEVLVASLTKFG